MKLSRINPWTASIFGLILMTLAFLLVGPVPFLPLPPSLPLTICSLVLHGVGSAAVIVSSYSCALSSTLKMDEYQENLSTFSIVSGLWTSAFSLGNCLGPSVTCILYDQVYRLY